MVVNVRVNALGGWTQIVQTERVGVGVSAVAIVDKAY